MRPGSWLPEGPARDVLVGLSAGVVAAVCAAGIAYLIGLDQGHLDCVCPDPRCSREPTWLVDGAR